MFADALAKNLLCRGKELKMIFFDTILWLNCYIQKNIITHYI